MKSSIRGLYSRAACTLGLLFLLLAIALPAVPAQRVLANPETQAAQPPNPRLVKDINQGSRLNMESGFFQLGEMLYFSGREQEHGAELWTCNLDGTGMALVKDIYPGIYGSDPVTFIVYKDELYFTASTEEFGRELWKTDGTAAGTVLVKDIFAGPSGQNRNPNSSAFAVASIYTDDLYSYLFFPATSEGTGIELWRTDGTADGTVMVKDINPGVSGSVPGSLTPFNNALYFSAWDASAGTELWKTDGTGAGTVMVADINPGTSYHSSYPQNLFVMPIPPRSSVLVFSASAPDAGRELFYSDTDGTTALLMDINPGSPGSQPNQFRMLGDFLYFIASDTTGQQIWRFDGNSTVSRVTSFLTPVVPTSMRLFAAATLPDRGAFKDWLLFTGYDAEHGEELWKTDGTATSLVKDIHPGTGGSSVDVMVGVQGKVYFRADDGTLGSELWSSDGTEAGTSLVKDVLPGSGSGNPNDLKIFKNRVLFNASVIFYENYPWISNGTETGTTPIHNLVPGNAGSAPAPEAALLNGKVIFSAETSTEGIEPWVSDGTPGGTMILKDVLPGQLSSRAEGFTRLGSAVLFNAYAPDSGRELWITDGTPGGTTLLKDLLPGLPSSNLMQLTAVDGMPGGVGPAQTLVFFVTSDPTSGFWLWKTDGTAQGTQRVEAAFSFIDTLVAGVGRLYLSASQTPYNGDIDMELWKSDGTAAGTTRVKDILPGAMASYPSDMVFHNGLLYFRANDGVHGYELWKSDGTEAGTLMLKNINAPDEYGNDPSSSPRNLTALGSKIVFAAEINGSGEEVWITDGTEPGTLMLRDIYPGISSSFPNSFCPMGGQMYFIAEDDASGSELWRTDGTPSGTVMVKDIYPGAETSYPSDLTAIGDMIYFQAADGEHGNELWKTNGSDAGTQMVADLYPGPEGSWPYGFQPIGNSLLFTADDGTHSYEPWIIDVPRLVYLPVLRR